MFVQLSKKGKTKMYETPKLNCVGNAQDVILGYFATGTDLDTTYCDNDMAYAEEDDGNSNGVSNS
jgi:hypothetical protein